VGILIVPHDASMNQLLHNASSGFAEGQRTIIALGAIAIGIVLSALAVITGFLKRGVAE